MTNIRILEINNNWYIKCKQGDHYHSFTSPFIIIPSNSHWVWDGSVECPTIRPSVKETRGVSGQSYEDFKRTGPSYINHYYITQGKIEYISDCTHESANKTEDIEPWTEEEIAKFKNQG